MSVSRIYYDLMCNYERFINFMDDHKLCYKFTETSQGPSIEVWNDLAKEHYIMSFPSKHTMLTHLNDVESHIRSKCHLYLNTVGGKDKMNGYNFIVNKIEDDHEWRHILYHPIGVDYSSIPLAQKKVIGCSRSVGIKNVIFNDPATIVIWDDGTKTVVKCQKGDIFDKEKGLAMAIAKKACQKGHYMDIFHEWIKEDEHA